VIAQVRFLCALASIAVACGGGASDDLFGAPKDETGGASGAGRPSTPSAGTTGRGGSSSSAGGESSASSGRDAGDAGSAAGESDGGEPGGSNSGGSSRGGTASGGSGGASNAGSAGSANGGRASGGNAGTNSGGRAGAGAASGAGAGSGGIVSGGAGSGGAAGTIGHAGSGGEDCAALLEVLEKRLAEAQECRLDVNRLTCVGTVTDECGCQQVVDIAGSAATRAYQNAVSAYQKQCEPSCPIVCLDVATGYCRGQGSSVIGRCVTSGVGGEQGP
jgi:hypothetical protein